MILFTAESPRRGGNKSLALQAGVVQANKMALTLLGILLFCIAWSPIAVPIIFGIYLAAKKKTPSWRTVLAFLVIETSAISAMVWDLGYLQKMD